MDEDRRDRVIGLREDLHDRLAARARREDRRRERARRAAGSPGGDGVLRLVREHTGTSRSRPWRRRRSPIPASRSLSPRGARRRRPSPRRSGRRALGRACA